MAAISSHGNSARTWDDDDKESAWNAVSCLWRNEYRSNTGIPQRTTPTFSSDNIYLQRFAEHGNSNNDHELDELEKYLQADVPIDIGNVSARKWWSESIQRARYPLLSKMAVDVLSISAMAEK